MNIILVNINNTRQYGLETGQNVLATNMCVFHFNLHRLQKMHFKIISCAGETSSLYTVQCN